MATLLIVFFVFVVAYGLYLFTRPASPKAFERNESMNFGGELTLIKNPSVDIIENPSTPIVDADLLEQSYELKSKIQQQFPEAHLEYHTLSNGSCNMRLHHNDGNVVAVIDKNVTYATISLAKKLGVTLDA